MSKRKTRDLRRVKQGKVLLWPDTIVSRDDSGVVRLRAGGVVDMDAPLERDLFCRGQEYKLESAEQSATPDPVLLPRALRKIKEWKDAQKAPPPPVDIKAKARGMEIMDPVEPFTGLQEQWEGNSAHVAVGFGDTGVTQTPPE